MTGERAASVACADADAGAGDNASTSAPVSAHADAGDHGVTGSPLVLLGASDAAACGPDGCALPG